MLDVTMRDRSLLHRVVERLLPWFDPEAEQRRTERTEQIRLRAIAARVRSERVMEEYRLADRKVRRG